MTLNKIKGVLFDYDGVLADTMFDNFAAWKYAFKKFGVNLKQEDYFPFEGMGPFKIAEKLGRSFGLNPSNYNKIAKLKDSYYIKNNKFKLFKGVDDLILFLKRKKIKIAIVSGVLEYRLRAVTDKNFLDFFDVIVTSDKIVNPKPHPEPYEKALSLLGLKANQVVVVENAPLGIESAKKASIYCIAICTTLDKSYLKKADKIVTSIEILKKELDQIC